MSRKKLEVPKSSLSITILRSRADFVREESEAMNMSISDIVDNCLERCYSIKESPIGRKLSLERELELLDIRASKVEAEVAKELIAQSKLEDIRIEKLIAKVDFEKANNLCEFGSRLKHNLSSQIEREKERLLEQLAQTDKSFEGSFDALLLGNIKNWLGEKPYESPHGPTTTAISLAKELAEKHGILAIKTFSGAWLFGLNMADWIRSICVSKKFPSREQCITAIAALQTFSLDQGRDEFWQCLNSKGYFKLDGMAHLSDLKKDYGPLVLGSPLNSDNLPQLSADLLEALDFVDHLYKSNTKSDFLSLGILEPKP